MLDVEFKPLGTLEGGPARITIRVSKEATATEQLDFWCTVAIPAGVEQLGPNNVQVWTVGNTFASGLTTAGTRVLSDPVCPGSAPPSLNR